MLRTVHLAGHDVKSDAAFNRAFTRYHGRTPGQWRHEHVTR
jgi:hypothetical protein